jgi:hypothetical protein
MGAAVVLELHNVLVFLDMVVHTPLFFATKESIKEVCREESLVLL